MKFVVNAYNGNTEWIKKYSDDIEIYDKSNKNVGYNIHDYMDWIIKNYENLPDIVAFVKDNMLERHITLEEWEEIKDNKTLTPILTQYHKTYEPVCYYKDGLYYEQNDSWYFNEHPHKYFNSFHEFAEEMGLPSPEYLGFAPGGCWIVPKENILKRPKKFYARLRRYVAYTQHPAEAHAIERSLYYIWL